jgi:PAS domain S-box-containing protein
MTATVPPLQAAAFPPGGGRAGEIIRARDWSSSPLGPIDSWPAALKVALGMILNSPDSMFLAWGRELTFFYNDAYDPNLGPRREWAMGAPFAELWADAWPTVSPIVDQALAGHTSRFDDLPVTMNRYGIDEQTWWSFYYSPLYDENSAVAGLFCVTNDTSARVQADLARRASERQLQSITDALPVLISDLDRDLRYRFVNRRYEIWFGKHHDDIVGKTLNDLLGDTTVAQRRPLLDRVLGGEHVVFDAWLPSPTGLRLCEIQYLPRYDEQNVIEGFTAIGIDVSERKAAAEALRISELRFRAIAEAMPGFVFTATPDGAFDYTSPRWHEYSGSTPEESSGYGWGAYVHPDDFDATVAGWGRAVASGEPLEMEYRLRSRDGSYRWWLGRAVPMRGPGGAIERWIGLCTELQTIVEARQTLARSRDDLEREVARRTQERDRVWNNSRDLLVVLGDDGIFTAVSPAWTRVLGHRPDEVLGRRYTDFMHPDDVLAGRAEIQRALERVDLTAFEVRYQHKNGDWRWISWHTSTEGAHIYCYGRDVSTEKAKDEALALAEEQLRQSQKMEAVGQLTGGIAHDFNNLLMGVIGSLELIQRYIQSGRHAEVERFAAMAMGSAHRAAALTHRLLAFSRRQPLDPRAVNADELIANMAELLKRTVGESTEIRIVGTADLWQTRCDPHQLESSILNLVINARDAMPRGGRLTIETANTRLDDAYALRNREVAPGEYVGVSITDNGDGMSSDVIARAYEPFFTTKPIGQGTGLGLSMVYGFTRQSGGHTKIYSEPGRGTTVKLYLPRCHANGELADADIVGATQRPAEASDYVVLVVEDDADVRSVVVEVLHDMRYTVLEAADGVQGLRLLQSTDRIDLLLTDVGLPGLNGRQVADAARLLRPQLKVLFMTGYAEKAAINGGFLDAGMELITKPFTIAALSQKISGILESVG